jgi:succinyl-CoA synthetase beta subunit
MGTEGHWMNLHEYQSKQRVAQYAIPTPKREVAGSPEAAMAPAQKLGGSLWVVRTQVHAGGRRLPVRQVYVERTVGRPAAPRRPK